MHAHLCAHTLTNAHKTRKRATHIRTHYTLTSMLNNIQILAHFQSGGLAEDNRPANDFQLTKRKLTYQSRIRRRLLQPLHSRFTNSEKYNYIWSILTETGFWKLSILVRNKKKQHSLRWFYYDVRITYLRTPLPFLLQRETNERIKYIRKKSKKEKASEELKFFIDNRSELFRQRSSLIASLCTLWKYEVCISFTFGRGGKSHRVISFAYIYMHIFQYKRWANKWNEKEENMILLMGVFWYFLCGWCCGCRPSSLMRWLPFRPYGFPLLAL